MSDAKYFRPRGGGNIKIIILEKNEQYAEKINLTSFQIKEKDRGNNKKNFFKK